MCSVVEIANCTKDEIEHESKRMPYSHEPANVANEAQKSTFPFVVVAWLICAIPIHLHSLQSAMLPRESPKRRRNKTTRETKKNARRGKRSHCDGTFSALQTNVATFCFHRQQKLIIITFRSRLLNNSIRESSACAHTPTTTTRTKKRQFPLTSSSSHLLSSCRWLRMGKEMRRVNCFWCAIFQRKLCRGADEQTKIKEKFNLFLHLHFALCFCTRFGASLRRWRWFGDAIYRKSIREVTNERWMNDAIVVFRTSGNA